MIKSTKSLGVHGLKTYLVDSELFIEGTNPIKFGTASDNDLASIMHYGGTSEANPGNVDGSCTFTLDTSAPRNIIEQCPLFVLYPQVRWRDVDESEHVSTAAFNAIIEENGNSHTSDTAIYLQPVKWDGSSYMWRMTPQIGSTNMFYTNSFKYWGILYRIH